MNSKRTVFALILLLSTLTLPTFSSEMFTGKVTKVISSDTLEITSAGKIVLVRLYGIDSPAIDQPFGAEARAFTDSKVIGKTVLVNVRSIDDLDRIVGEVLLPDNDGILNFDILQAGLAWWDKPNAPDEASYRSGQLIARIKNLGLWQDKAPVAPWAWRRGVRIGSKEVRKLPTTK